MTEAYPLQWPEGWPRTHYADRKWSLAGGRTGSSWDRSVKRLLTEIARIGGENVVLSTNQPLRRDGLPYANSGRIDDPGAAVYFTRDGRQYVMAQDGYELIMDNIRSLALAIEGLRQMERHGGAHMMEKAFSGFESLPPPTWRGDLGLAPDATIEDAEAQYRKRARTAHPDMGGSADAMARLNAAIAQARQELSP